MHADPQLPVCFVDCLDRIHTVSVEIVCGMLQVAFGILQCAERILYFRMPLERW